MNALVVYDSQFGTSERIARAVAEQLGSARLVTHMAESPATTWRTWNPARKNAPPLACVTSWRA